MVTAWASASVGEYGRCECSHGAHDEEGCEDPLQPIHRFHPSVCNQARGRELRPPYVGWSQAIASPPRGRHERGARPRNGTDTAELSPGTRNALPSPHLVTPAERSQCGLSERCGQCRSCAVQHRESRSAGPDERRVVLPMPIAAYAATGITFMTRCSAVRGRRGPLMVARHAAMGITQMTPLSRRPRPPVVARDRSWSPRPYTCPPRNCPLLREVCP
jgi:hypothetical protein